MIRKGLLVPALAASALIGVTPAQAALEFSSISSIIDQLHDNSTFTANNMEFSICQNGSCQTLFTGVGGVQNVNMATVNAWAGTGNAQNSSSPWDRYRFTFSGVGSYFGNQSSSVPPQNYTIQSQAPTLPVPEPATWAMMIFGFGVIGYAMRSRPVVIDFG
ncbi:MAG: PEP-CTERM sorting domain-containing protein [Sphingobium sp.]|nr:PEP-CTERM sorting domain-containing protein [Sphingobium sp.]